MGAFDFTYVVFHLQYGQTNSTRRAEAQQLADVYAYFQAQNGSESDVLIGGDFNLPGSDAAFTLVGVDGISYITDPEQKTSIGTYGLANSFDKIFYTGSTRELVASGAHDYTMANWSEVVISVSDHIPVWAPSTPRSTTTQVARRVLSVPSHHPPYRLRGPSHSRRP